METPVSETSHFPVRLMSFLHSTFKTKCKYLVFTVIATKMWRPDATRHAKRPTQEVNLARLRSRMPAATVCAKQWSRPECGVLHYLMSMARLPKSKNIVIKITETLIKEMGELFNCHHCQNSKAGLHNNAWTNLAYQCKHHPSSDTDEWNNVPS